MRSWHGAFSSWAYLRLRFDVVRFLRWRWGWWLKATIYSVGLLILNTVLGEKNITSVECQNPTIWPPPPINVSKLRFVLFFFFVCRENVKRGYFYDLYVGCINPRTSRRCYSCKSKTQLFYEVLAHLKGKKKV